MLTDMSPLYAGVQGNYNDAVTDIDDTIVTYTYMYILCRNEML